MIRHAVTFRSPLSVNAAREALLGWLEAIGYRLTSPPFLSTIQAARGNIISQYLAFNPVYWLATLTAEFRPDTGGCTVEIRWEISTRGQIGTRADIVHWRYEVGKIMEVCQGEPVDILGYRAQTSRATTGNVMRAIVFLLCPILLLIPYFVGAIPLWVAAVVAIPAACAVGFGFRMPRRLAFAGVANPSDAPPVR